MKLTKRHARKVLEIVDCGLTDGMGVPEPGKLCVEAAVCLALGLPHSDDPPCVGMAVREFKIRLNDSRWSSDQARAKGLRRLAIAQLGSDTLNQTEFVTNLSQAIIRKILPRSLRAAARIHSDETHRKAMTAAANQCSRDGSHGAAASAARAAACAADSAAYAADSAAYAAARAADSAARAAACAAESAAYAAAYAAARAADSAAYAAARAADSAACAADSAAYAADSAAYAAAYAADSAGGDESLAIAAETCVEVLQEMGSPGCKWLDITEE